MLIVSADCGHAADAKPNVLLICVDDLKPLLGCYGDKVVKSPNIDRLAARGIVFERAYCNQAVCAPSRNALMTGLRPATIGIYDLETNFRKAVPDAVTVTQHFMKHGYRAEAMGKIMHVGHGNGEDAASWSSPHWKPGGGQYRRPNNAGRGADARGTATENADVEDNAYGDGMIADEAIVRLRAAAQDPKQPFFFGVGFMKPHLPFVAPKKYWDLYEPSAFALPLLKTPPKGAPEFAPSTWGELRNYSDMPKRGPLTDTQTRHLIHGYHAATSYMDAQLGRVLNALDETGLAKNTVVILWGDHGWHLGDHGLWCKHTNYEQAARIPLIVSMLGVTREASRTVALAETVDLYPTLCELAGLPIPSGLDGRSLLPTLKDPAADTKGAIFHFYPRQAMMGRAVRTADHRLVEWKKPGAPAEDAVIELYDYKADPAETENLAERQPETVARLRAVLARQPEAKPQFKSKPLGFEPSKAGPGAKDRGAMFDKRDADKDGKLTRQEFLAGQPDPEEAPKRFPRFDTNRDGELSREEFIGGGR